MIKAIETAYNGYRFRSRLEARWAVFFDAVGRKYRYEPEGFELPSGWYLPDFWLPHIVEGLADQGWGHWCEIKPVYPTEDEKTKLGDLAMSTYCNAVILYGDCRYDGYNMLSFKVTHKVPSEMAWEDGCAICGYDFIGTSASDLLIPVATEQIMKAFDIASSARFEFGEQGVQLGKFAELAQEN